MSENIVGVQKPAKPPIWNDPVYRALFFQVLVLGGVIFAGYVLVSNTLHNLERQGIASGFGFMKTTAGFSILMNLIDYTESDSYFRAFIVSLLNTLLVAAIGVFFATILGFLIGVARLSNNWLISKMAAVYIETLRNIPLLLQIFFWYFGVLRQLPQPKQSVNVLDLFFLNNRGLYSPAPVPEEGFSSIIWTIVVSIIIIIYMARWAHKRQMATGQQFHTVYVSLAIIIGLPFIATVIAGFPMSWEYPTLQGFNYNGGLSLIPELVSLSLALSLYTASFIAEIVRAGIMAVSHGQTEAAYAVGLRPGPTLRLVVIPQALRVIIPPLTSQYLNLTKNSSLAAAIAYPDLVLVFAGTVLMQTGQAVEVIAITMGVYLTISLLISAFMNWYNNKMALVER
ncbi:MAG: amino acid ABC transporter permease [Rhodospirillaceae bacterium]|nr:amino acid ABC transporter permease [Rhodospirillaceae bacterium]